MYSILLEKIEKIVIEKSKFITYIFRCETFGKQAQILKNLKREHLSSTHICYASIIDDGSLKTSYSDDKEPSGTAGLAILQVLKENDLVNVLCAVVRYFGGIKLGANNLGRAYKQGVIRCLDKNKIQVELSFLFRVKCDYQIYNNKLKPFLSKKKIEIFNSNFDDNVYFEAYLSKDDEKFLTNNDIDFVKTDNSKYIEIR